MPGWRFKLVALVDVQLSVDDWPFSIVLGSAVKVTVGAAGFGGGGAGGGGAAIFFLWHAPANKTTPSKPTNTASTLFLFAIISPPKSVIKNP